MTLSWRNHTRSSVPQAAGMPFMLAERCAAPFDDPAWLFELKYDGFRALAALEAGQPRLFYRGGSDATACFPEIAGALARLRCADAVLDGELVVLDGRGRPQFQRLQQRFSLRRTPDAARAAAEHPACFFAFDLLRLDGRDLRAEPLAVRKARLRRLLPLRGRLGYVQHVRGRGEALFAQVQRRGLEGVVAKRADSAYQGGRSRLWLKITAERTGDFVVVGLTRVAGGQEGSLHLAVGDGDGLTYAGSVGTGFKAGTLAEARRLLEPYALPAPPCGGTLPPVRSVNVGAPDAGVRGPLQGVDGGGPAAAARVPALPSRGARGAALARAARPGASGRARPRVILTHGGEAARRPAHPARGLPQQAGAAGARRGGGRAAGGGGLTPCADGRA